MLETRPPFRLILHWKRLPLTLQPSTQYHVYRRRVLAQSLPGGVCLLLKAIGASEGWHNAIRYHTRSLSQPPTRIPPLAGFSLPPKALLQTEVTCQSPKTANWPRAMDAGRVVATCVILLEKTRILCNFIKLFPPAFPAGLGTARPGWPQLCSKNPNFIQFYEKTPAPVSKPGSFRNVETPG